MTSTLILLRHGESTWNALNQFTGWVDVPLSEKGTAEAIRGGTLLTEAGVLPDVLHTSLLRRAITTANLALDEADRHWIPVRRTWRLNERHYGDLQGKDKKQTLQTYGEEQFMLWRRSYDTPPPPISDTNEYSQADDPRYAELGDDAPKTECLADVVARMESYLYGPIFDDLQGRQAPCWWPRTATRCGPWSRCSTGSATRASPRSTCRPASRCKYELDADLRAGHGRWRLPGPGSGGRGHHRGGQPGQVVRRPGPASANRVQANRRSGGAPR